MVETVIIDPSINRIIALSDIHSDIHAFIICLRDCAKVIRKVRNVNTRILPDVHKIDQDTEDMLELNLNDDEVLYKDNLNYEWIGGNTNIVICGDILDGGRSNATMLREGKNRCGNINCTNLEYDQVEIKLLKFINSINLLANKSGGRIYKVLGNHDFANLSNLIMKDQRPFAASYIPTWTLNEPNYYHGFERLAYFNAGKPGSELLLQGGAYLGLIINNNIFVHGQLDHKRNLQYYINKNNQINDPANNNLNPNNIWNELVDDNDTSWGRRYDRNASGINNNRLEQLKKCTQVRDFLQIFYTQIQAHKQHNEFEAKDLRVIVGHCPQFMGNQLTSDLQNQGIGTINSTFINKQVDGNIEILSGPTVRTGLQNLDLLFGIGMECNKHNLDKFPSQPVDDNDQRYIYKVDVGSMRGFDFPVETISKRGRDYPEARMPVLDQNVKLELGSRTPQVLEIIGQNDIRIIRSTILNTRIHQPRPAWEAVLNGTVNKLNIPAAPAAPAPYVDEDGNPYLPGLAGGSYKEKYLKYKNKYIELKKKMNN
jgi:hypothetical protein